MVKSIGLAIVGLILGLVVGAAAMNFRLMPTIAQLETEKLEQSLAMKASRRTDGSDARLARLEEERETYEASLEKLRTELASARKMSLEQSAPLADPLLESTLESGGAAEVSEPLQEGGGRDGSRRRGGPWGGGGTPEEQEARRQEFVGRIQENLTIFFTGELEKSNDTASQERLVALETQVQDMMAIRGQMRAAESDEARDALNERYRASQEAAQAIMQEQQGAMVDAMAAQFGITGKAERRAFQQAVQAAVDRPFFSDNPMGLVFRGAGRFGGGGFRGPGGRR